MKPWNTNTRAVRHIICLTALVLILKSAKCQWNIFHYEDARLSSQSLIPNKADSLGGYYFFNTSFDFSSRVIRSAFNPLISEGNVWFTNLSYENIPKDKTVYLNVYTNNLSGILIRIYENDSNYSESYVNFNNDGYQLPFEITLNNSKSDVDSLFSAVKNRSNKFPLFACYPIIKDRSKISKLLVGEAKIFQKILTKKPSEANWFYEITKKNENKISNQPITNLGDNIPFINYGDFVNYRGGDFNFQLENLEKDSIKSQLETLELIKEIFLKYPYFKKTQLLKTKIIKDIEKIINSDLPFQTKINSLKQVADSFHDAHFYLSFTNLKSPSVTSPLIIKKINNQLQVVGIRDTSLNAIISLGDKIVSINDIDPEYLITHLSNNYFGEEKQRKELAISHLIEKEISTKTDKVTFEKANGTKYTITLKYDKKFPAPQRFIPEHFRLKNFENSWSYLKMNKWDRGDWIRFFNIGDTLKEKKGIIFDLRGNPGGFETEVVKIASTFLNSPTLYCSHSYGNSGEEKVFRSTIKPNEFLDLSKLKVIILVDNRTACAAEAFTLFLKESIGALVIGASNTAGAYSTVYNFQLPYNVMLSSNILSKTSFLEKQIILQNNSIQPDIKVDIRNYKDLYGYNDKVLLKALMVIDRSMSNIN